MVHKDNLSIRKPESPWILIYFVVLLNHVSYFAIKISWLFFFKLSKGNVVVSVFFHALLHT